MKNLLADIMMKSENPDLFEYIIYKKLHGTKSTVKKEEGVPPLTFTSSGFPLNSYEIYGNTVQNGTPTPSNPVEVKGVGELETTGEHTGEYKIPISCGGQTVPIYLGQVQTTRNIKKLVLTGDENWSTASGGAFYALSISPYMRDRNDLLSSHFFVDDYSGALKIGQLRGAGAPSSTIIFNYDNGLVGVDGFKAWLATQYANGTPVTVWYVFATAETATVNEPLMKIGNYADTLDSEGEDIDTDEGSNTFDVDTTVTPSNVIIYYT